MHALLDSESAAAAYRFTIRPGDTTVFDVEMAIYPRVDLEHAGLAPMTSMFFFGPNDRNDVDDFRPSVHDSDGLAIFNGRGEELWRPLSNPQRSSDQHVRRSQSARVRPDAAAEGFSSPTRILNRALNDGRACGRSRSGIGAKARCSWSKFPPRKKFTTTSPAFGIRRRALQAKGEYTYTYRLHWGPDSPKPTSLARFSRTAVGARGEDIRIFVLDLTGDKLKSVDPKNDPRRRHAPRRPRSRTSSPSPIRRSAAGG